MLIVHLKEETSDHETPIASSEGKSKRRRETPSRLQNYVLQNETDEDEQQPNNGKEEEEDEVQSTQS